LAPECNQYPRPSLVMKITEVTTPTPEQQRIKTMQAQVQQAQQRVKQERVRQQQTRLNQQLSKLAGM